MRLADLTPRFFVTPWVGMAPGTSYAQMLAQRRGMGLSFACPCGANDHPRILLAFMAPLDGGPRTSEDLPLAHAVMEADTWEGLTLGPFDVHGGGSQFEVRLGQVHEVTA